ncbi:prepilin-type N-terminal cleavage/methylation domain-containing protein [Patescibacteria group bacterium]|nr:prepilin-type N-terminal cleavage/methylation domain-containing protein [Patescibacteria group bacterium]
MFSQHKNQIFTERHFFKKNRAGFTLIEVLISIAVLTIGIVTALGLAISNFNNNRDNFLRVTGANLAREGLELVRNVRDSNWLKIDSNNVANCGSTICRPDVGLYQTNLLYIDYLDDLPDLISRSYSCNNNLINCTTNCTSCVLYRNAQSFLDHNNTGLATNMKRLIRLQKICTDPGEVDPQDNEYLKNMTENCNAGDSYIGMEVTSHVQWTRSNGSLDYIDISEKLYNWRR